MAILVTGGTGYIGSHAVVELAKAGYDVIIVDNLSNSKRTVVDTLVKITGREIRFVEGDIRDAACMDALFGENDIDAVIHFAGLKAVGESVKKPLDYYENNVGGSMTLFRAMQKHGCKRLVFSSSATVYGEMNPVPYREEFLTRAMNPYGGTKVVIENILIDMCAADPEWSVALLRYFNPVGAHDSGLIGENPNGIPNNLMPYIAQVAAGKLPMLHVYGHDYGTRDGTGVRDYIHVVDLARGHIAALKYCETHNGAEAINLGTGRGTSVLELVAAFELASGKRIPFVVDPRRPGDLPEYYACTDKAEKLLSWQAKLGIYEMCRDTWYFQQKTINKG